MCVAGVWQRNFEPAVCVPGSSSQLVVPVPETTIFYANQCDSGNTAQPFPIVETPPVTLPGTADRLHCCDHPWRSRLTKHLLDYVFYLDNL